MSKKKIRRPRSQPPADGIERWRCPKCRKRTAVLVFDRATEAQPTPPDPSFVCRDCRMVWDYKTGASLLGSNAAAAALRVLQIQGKMK